MAHPGLADLPGQPAFNPAFELGLAGRETFSRAEGQAWFVGAARKLRSAGRPPTALQFPRRVLVRQAPGAHGRQESLVGLVRDEVFEGRVPGHNSPRMQGSYSG